MLVEMRQIWVAPSNVLQQGKVVGHRAQAVEKVVERCKLVHILGPCLATLQAHAYRGGSQASLHVVTAQRPTQSESPVQSSTHRVPHRIKAGRRADEQQQILFNVIDGKAHKELVQKPKIVLPRPALPETVQCLQQI
jgi:hypothetical protein